MKKILSLILCVVLCFGMIATLASCSQNYTENNTKVKIGLSGPLSGDASVYGKAVHNSAKLAVSEINALAKDKLGFEFEIVMVDDKHDPSLINANYAELFEGGMQISLGTVTTAPGLNYKSLSYDDNVFVLTPSASGDKIPELDNAFQMCFADSEQGTASAEFFNENYKGKTVGVFYKADDDYSKGIYSKFKAALDSSFDLKEASFKGEQSDFTQHVQNLKDCDVIFMPIYYTPASQFMTKGKDTIKDNAIYFGCDGLDGIDSMDGFDITKIPQEVSYLSHFNSGATDGAAADYIEAYKDAYPNEPLNQFGAAAYDCVWAIYYALLAAKEDGKEFNVTTSASDYCDILKEVFTSNDFVYHGITGKAKEDGKSDISWKESGLVNKDAVKYVVKEAD